MISGMNVSDAWPFHFHTSMTNPLYSQVLFNLLVTNNWDECELGFEAVTEAKWVRWFFLLFHLIAVVLVNNLVVAFVIEAFLEQLTLSKSQGDDDALRHGTVILNGGHVVLKTTAFKGMGLMSARPYRVRLRHAASDITGSKEVYQDLEESLTKLLSQPISQT